MKFIGYINRSIEYLFYSLFLIVPLVFAGNTSELFEFSKMWFTFGVTSIILALWLSKMILLKRVVFKRTFFDIPILLFLIAHIVSTVISLDSYISLWGYYSRWNGGLLSIITYVILYYAFVSNFFNNKIKTIKNVEIYNPSGRSVVTKSLLISIISGLIVAIWALPSHFGYDPTCLIFRGSLDVSCWTADFQPKVRIFGPLGQPAWLGAYMGTLLSITLAYVVISLRNTKKLLDPKLIFYSISFILFYLTLLYTASRSGAIAIATSLFLFVLIYLILNRHDLSFLKSKFTIIFISAIIFSTFFAGINFPIINNFSLKVVREKIQANKAAPQNSASPVSQTPPPVLSALESGGSSSFAIRKIVWKGGLDAWLANPIFGTGVETYAFAYYKFRPIEHNNLSEWNFLYNKAHNEFLNYLTTTGLFGFLSYMAFIIMFIFLVIVNLWHKKIKKTKYLGQINATDEWDIKDPLILALMTAFISILVNNFIGFSVVILNIYLFLIPAFVLILLDLIKSEETNDKFIILGYPQWSGIAFVVLIPVVVIIILSKFWIADTKYALGSNYNNAGDPQTAYPLLKSAVEMRKEPVFENELAVNQAALALILGQQNSSESAQVIQELANESLTTSDRLVKEHPNNIVFWKSRVKILYSLSNFDPSFLPLALEAIKNTSVLAPTDASVLYNLGVLYGQNGDSKTAAEILERTIAYRPNYLEAHFALGLFYHDLAIDPASGRIRDKALHDKAIAQMNFILKNFDPNNKQVKDSLSAWEAEK